jgi:hypothetical protein
MDLQNDEAAIAARLKADLTKAEAVGKNELSTIESLWTNHKVAVIVIGVAAAILGVCIAKLI